MSMRINHFQQLVNRVTVFNGIVQDCMAQQDAPVFNQVQHQEYSSLDVPFLGMNTIIGNLCVQITNAFISQVYLSNIFEKMELGLTQSILEAVVDHIPSGG